VTIGDFLSVPALIGSALGATIFGWVGAYIAVKGRNFATKQDVDFLRQDLRENAEIMKSVEQKFGRSDILWRGELAFRQQQLAELYGPVYGYLKSQQDIYGLWVKGGMIEKNFEVKKLFSSQNLKMRELIVAKAHLIEGSVMPDSFVRFFTSTLIFDLYAATTNEGLVPQHLRGDTRSAYPLDFNDHIVRVTEALKTRIQDLNEQYAPALGLPQHSSSTGGESI
jgi:hypothetical protein